MLASPSVRLTGVRPRSQPIVTSSAASGSHHAHVRRRALRLITAIVIWLLVALLAISGGARAADAYDTVGNLTSATTPAGSTTYTYDLADRITSGGAAPVYDANGNLLTDGSYGNRAYSYDALGRLTGVTGNGTTAMYALDGAGNRTAEALNGVTTGFDLDLSVPEPTILSDGTRTYLPGDPGAGYQEAGVWWSALTDQIGSPLSYVNVAGATTTAVHYDPYGAPRPGSADPTGIGYAGEWKNATGLANLRARAYDPLVGRFTGRDTFGGVASAPQTANRYSYALNNPLRYTDPSGHFVQAFQDNPRLALSTTLQLFPGLGDGYSGLTGVLGFDPIAGVALADWERGLAFAAMLPWVPGLGGLLGRTGDDVAGGLRNADELAGAAGFTRAGEHYDMGPTRFGGELGGRGRVGDEVASSGGWIRYGDLDTHGRPTGVEARLTPSSVKDGGSTASRSIKPPGFRGAPAGHARGHLLGRQLGGSGKEPRNLVTLFQNPTNSPVMRGVESAVRRHLNAGESFDYWVTPIYRGAEPIAIGITIEARGSTGTYVALSILNREL